MFIFNIRISLFKLISYFILITSLVIDLYDIYVGYSTAVENRSLTGAGRAQAGMFVLGHYFVFCIIGIISLVLLIVNLIIDFLNKDIKKKYNFLLYIGFAILILIAIFVPNLLVKIMESGW